MGASGSRHRPRFASRRRHSKDSIGDSCVPARMNYGTSNDDNAQSLLTLLPHETVVQIAANCDFMTLCCLQRVSRHLRQIAADDRIWQFFFFRDFGRFSGLLLDMLSTDFNPPTFEDTFSRHFESRSYKANCSNVSKSTSFDRETCSTAFRMLYREARWIARELSLEPSVGTTIANVFDEAGPCICPCHGTPIIRSGFKKQPVLRSAQNDAFDERTGVVAETFLSAKPAFASRSCKTTCAGHTRNFGSDCTELAAKLVVVGDDCGIDGRGKTSLLWAHLNNASAQVEEGFAPTVFDNSVQNLVCATRPKSQSEQQARNLTGNIQLSIYDSSGHESFDRLRPLCYSGADVFMVVFSLVDPVSFEHAWSIWIPEIRRLGEGNKPIILVGIERHLRDDPAALRSLQRSASRERHLTAMPVASTQARNQAAKSGVAYFEVCIERGIGVRPLFRTAVKAALDPAHFNAVHSPEAAFCRLTAMQAAADAVARVLQRNQNFSSGSHSNDDEDDRNAEISTSSDSPQVGTWPGNRPISPQAFGSLFAQLTKAADTAFFKSLICQVARTKGKRRKPLAFARTSSGTSFRNRPSILMDATRRMAKMPSVDFLVSSGHVGVFRSFRPESSQQDLVDENRWKVAWTDDGLMYWTKSGTDQRSWLPPPNVLLHEYFTNLTPPLGSSTSGGTGPASSYEMKPAPNF